jgi:hypothetical protein
MMTTGTGTHTGTVTVNKRALPRNRLAADESVFTNPKEAAPYDRR